MTECSIDVQSGMEESLLQATTGLVIYESRRHGGREAFATVHAIAQDSAGVPVFMEGRAITREALLSLTEKLLPDASHDYLPPEVLALGADWVVWWAESGSRTVFFDTDKSDPIGKRTIKAHLPPLVFAAKGEVLYVFALTKNERPMPGSPLCMAPFYNVWETNIVCQGSSRRPERSGPSAIGQWESGFFGSAFTHPNTGKKKTTRHPKGVSGLWQDIAAGRWKRFPVNMLAPADFTLSDLVGMMKKGRDA